jgi:sec-independent protein translocase protein TatC
MPFLDHLEELRWRLLKSLAAILVGAVVSFTFSDQLLKLLTSPYEEAVLSLERGTAPGMVKVFSDFLRQRLAGAVPDAPPADGQPTLPPTRRLQALKPTTYFMLTLQVGLVGGAMLALPVIFYQLWQFVAPGLLYREKRLILPIVALSVVCFALGVAVAYWLVLPVGLRFFLSLEPANMTSQWAVDEYIGFVIRMILCFGLVFEMPVVALFLARIGLVNAGHLRRFRRYAIVAIFIVAAILTPPDPLSQLLMAFPLLFLYEVSIWICRIAATHRRRPDLAATDPEARD